MSAALCLDDSLSDPPLLRTGTVAGGHGLLDPPGEAASDAAGFGFQCPACTVAQRVFPHDFGDVFYCRGCGETLVAPHPGAGRGAVIYRDWLRAAGDRAAPAARAVAAVPSIDPSPAPAKAARVGAGVALVCAFVLVASGVVLTSTVRWNLGPDRWGPEASRATRNPASDPQPFATAPPPAPLSDFLLRQGGRKLDCTVRVSLAHSFERSAPPTEEFLCVEVADPSRPEIVVRAFAPRQDPAAAALESSLRWGDQPLARVALAWQSDDRASDEVPAYLCLSAVHEFVRP